VDHISADYQIHLRKMINMTIAYNSQIDQ